MPWQPLPGPQALALNSQADELFYGGAAGGGKTFYLLGNAAMHKKSVVFRRTYPRLFEIVQTSRELFRECGTYNGNEHFWRFATGGLMEFRALQYEHDKYNYKGRPHDFYGWDEVTEFTESQYRYVNAWNRTTDPRQRCRIVAAGNPPGTHEGQWVKTYWGAWLGAAHPNPALPGELRWYARLDDKDEELANGQPFMHEGKIIYPRSRTFIPASVKDNPFLGEAYIGMLQSLPEPARSQLLYGDWSIGAQDDQWQVIPTAWVLAAVERWQRGKPVITEAKNGRVSPHPLSALGCDIAHGGEDATVIAKLYGHWFDALVSYPGSATDSGEKAANLILKEWSDGAPLGIDVIGYGVSAYDALRGRNIPVKGINFAAESKKRDKTGHYGFLNLRAECWWKLREALDPEGDDRIALPDDPELIADLTSPRWEPTARGIKIEPKSEVKQRLGRSPDKGDAVALAWKAALIKKATNNFKLHTGLFMPRDLYKQ